MNPVTNFADRNNLVIGFVQREDFPPHLEQISTTNPYSPDVLVAGATPVAVHSDVVL